MNIRTNLHSSKRISFKMWLLVLIFCGSVQLTTLGKSQILVESPPTFPFSVKSYFTAIYIKETSDMKETVFREILDHNSPVMLGIYYLNSSYLESLHTLIVEISNHTTLVRYSYLLYDS